MYSVIEAVVQTCTLEEVLRLSAHLSVCVVT
jgi:hypothetical protein